MRPKLSHVAASAGLGESTVSRVLRGEGSFSQQARERVLTAAAELGYVPNRIAGTLASSGSPLVALVMPSLSNIVFADVLQGAALALETTHHQAVFAITDYESQREEALVRAMLAWRPKAVVLAGLEHTSGTVNMLRAAGCRVLELLDVDGSALDIAIGYSNLAAGKLTAHHLLARGYRRIGYVGHNLSGDLRANKRLSGFRETLAMSGVALADSLLTSAESSVEDGGRGLRLILERTPNLDAVYFSNDDMAIGGYFHCIAQGLGVPSDIALFGFNGLDIGALLPQPLSTVRTPRGQIGQIAATMIANEARSQVVDLGFELIEGATA